MKACVQVSRFVAQYANLCDGAFLPVSLFPVLIVERQKQTLG